jgi:Domain of unknown function (DUF1707)
MDGYWRSRRRQPSSPGRWPFTCEASAGWLSEEPGARLAHYRAWEALVIAGPGDNTGAAWGSGGLRASDAEREQVIGVLKAAFVQGQLSRIELDVRAGQTFAARTWADLAALTADLSAGLTPAQPVREPRARTRPKASKVAIWDGRGLIAPALFVASLAVAFGGLVSVALLLALAGMVYFAAWLVPRAREAEWGSN